MCVCVSFHVQCCVVVGRTFLSYVLLTVPLLNIFFCCGFVEVVETGLEMVCEVG